MSIILRKNPEKVQELLQYMSVIRDSARKHDGLLWHDYDDSQTKASSICQFLGTNKVESVAENFLTVKSAPV